MKTPEKLRIAAAIKRGQAKKRWTNMRLAKELGISPTMVGFWTQGRYMPSVERAIEMSVLLAEPAIHSLTVAITTGTCRLCGEPFINRESHGRMTRRLYCSDNCRNNWYLGSRPERHPSLEAIAAFCAGCEPEGVCRTFDCSLRAFSPLPYAPRRAA